MHHLLIVALFATLALPVTAQYFQTLGSGSAGQHRSQS